MGEAFMTTHSFALDRLDGEYAIRVQEYEDGYEPTLASCRETVSCCCIYQHKIVAFYVLLWSLVYRILAV